MTSESQETAFFPCDDADVRSGTDSDDDGAAIGGHGVVHGPTSAGSSGVMLDRSLVPTRPVLAVMHITAMSEKTGTAVEVYASVTPSDADSTPNVCHKLAFALRLNLSRRPSPEWIVPPQIASTLSRLHCVVTFHFARSSIDEPFKLQRIIVVDMNSKNGTCINGVRIVPLHRYDLQMPGRVFLTFNPNTQVASSVSVTVLDGTESRTADKQPPRFGEVTQAVEPAKYTRKQPPRAPRAVKQRVPVGDGQNPMPRPSAAPSLAPAALVMATTGMRLTAEESAACKRLHIEVNPDVPEYHRITHFVIDPPLIRSVKFMCAIATARYIVHRSWFDGVLRTGNVQLPTKEHLYKEPITRRSIERQYGFSLERLSSVPLESRMRHFRTITFFVQPEAEPNDPPNNDMRSVIEMSGGALTSQIEEAQVVVLAPGPWSGAVGRALRCFSRRRTPVPLLVSPEDVFCSVLTQEPIRYSTFGPSAVAAVDDSSGDEDDAAATKASCTTARCKKKPRIGA